MLSVKIILQPYLWKLFQYIHKLRHRVFVLTDPDVIVWLHFLGFHTLGPPQQGSQRFELCKGQLRDECSLRGDQRTVHNIVVMEYYGDPI